MAKPFSLAPKAEAKPAAATQAEPEPQKNSMAYTVRETIESIVIAFVLAFLFRTFEAEAFVIPTGSMAPTLQGRHKDVVCPSCNFGYRVSASSEVNDLTGQFVEKNRVQQVTCPMCRYVKDIEHSSDPSFNGDRILVGKFPYDFSEPKRWDVIVFKYPGDAKMNYIKRLVGLPNEHLMIFQGDLYRIDDEKQQDEILRKSPDKIQAMAQLVYDNDYIVDSMTQLGWPLRWQPWAASEDTGWKLSDDGRGYEIDIAQDATRASQPQWVRYQHYPPSQADWMAMEKGLAPKNIRPQLITDFYAYNTNADLAERDQDRAHLAGLHWVGDLMLTCEVDVRSESGKVLLDLVRGGEHFVCSFDVATGEVQLNNPGQDVAPKGTSKLKGAGKYEVAMANFDRELTVWVNGAVVEFDAPTVHFVETDRPVSTPQNAGDLAPAGVGVDGASVQVNHLRLYRDIYYIAQNSNFYAMNDFKSPPNASREDLKRVLSDPARWGIYDPEEMRYIHVQLEDDQFYVLGDNSPFSKDARLWEADPHVKRELLIGKALYIYWPHSFDKLPGTKVPFPFFPNFGAMGFVR